MCTLKIHSETISFLPYSEETNLPVISCQIKGQARGQRQNEYHRISIEVSDKDWGDFKGQVTDAIKFLAEHEQELRLLISSHEATEAYLDFPLYSRLNENIINQNDHLPRQLIGLAGRIGLGIEMAIYDKADFDEPAA